MKPVFWLTMLAIAEVLLIRDPYQADDYILPIMFLGFWLLDLFGDHKELFRFLKNNQGRSLKFAWDMYRLEHGYRRCSNSDCRRIYRSENYLGDKPKCFKCRGKP